jgi:hypothetical protein
MKERTARPRVISKRKNRNTPLDMLRKSDVVKIVSDSPRRLEELLCLLESRERRVRDKAAATLAQLVAIHPSRLLRSVPRFLESLLDESAYVRWHVVYALGFLVGRYPSRLKSILPNLLECLEDQNRIVRILSSKALAQIAARSPEMVEEAFRGTGKAVPAVVADIFSSHLAEGGAEFVQRDENVSK